MSSMKWSYGVLWEEVHIWPPLWRQEVVWWCPLQRQDVVYWHSQRRQEVEHQHPQWRLEEVNSWPYLYDGGRWYDVLCEGRKWRVNFLCEGRKQIDKFLSEDMTWRNNILCKGGRKSDNILCEGRWSVNVLCKVRMWCDDVLREDRRLSDDVLCESNRFSDDVFWESRSWSKRVPWESKRQYGDVLCKDRRQTGNVLCKGRQQIFGDVFRKLVQWLLGKGVLVELASRATAGRVRRPWQLCFLQSPNTNGHLPFGEESDASSLSAQGSEAGCLWFLVKDPCVPPWVSGTLALGGHQVTKWPPNLGFRHTWDILWRINHSRPLYGTEIFKDMSFGTP